MSRYSRPPATNRVRHWLGWDSAGKTGRTIATEHGMHIGERQGGRREGDWFPRPATRPPWHSERYIATDWSTRRHAAATQKAPAP